MDNSERAAIEARNNARTPGSWRTISNSNRSNLVHVEVDEVGTPVCSIPKKREADADFIAHCADDITAFLAETAAQAAEIAGLKQQVVRIDDAHYARCAEIGQLKQQLAAYASAPVVDLTRVVRYRVSDAPPSIGRHPADDVCVHERYQRDGSRLWVVVNGIESVLAKDGIWEWEPQPSSRDEAFVQRTRWDSFESALSAARQSVAQPNAGDK